MDEMRYFSLVFLLNIEGMDEAQEVEFPVKTTTSAADWSSVTLAAWGRKEVKKRLKGAKIISTVVLPMSKLMVEAHFSASSEGFPVYQAEPKLTTPCFIGRKEKCNTSRSK
jgi:hypothetical protein